MFRMDSIENLHTGVGNSGALSHVYIEHPPLRFNIPETQGFYYDDGNKLVISSTSDQILSWKIGSSSLVDPPDADSIEEGLVLSVRYSLNRKLIGVQRSNNEIQFKNRETGETFSQRCKPDSESILGFFWTDCPMCDVIVVKTSGLDLLSCETGNSLHLVEAKRFRVSWYVYTHETRMVLVAYGMQCTSFRGFQFSSGGIVSLPKFEIKMSKAEANQKPVLAADDIQLVTVYGRIYCLQHDRVGMLLYFYRFYRDAVVQQGRLPVYSTRIAVSVVDNVILVHQVDAKVVILYDIFLDSLAPISAPLPLLLRGSSTDSKNQVQVEESSRSAYWGTIYGDNWTFLVPDLICDVDNGLLWRIHLDLEAIAASSSNVPSLLDFLQRRRSDPAQIKLLCLTIMRTVILERRPISMIAKALDVLIASYSISRKMENALQGGAKKDVSERDQDTSLQHTHDSGVRTDIRNRMKSHEKSVVRGSCQLTEDANDELREDAPVSSQARVPARSASYSEIIANSEPSSPHSLVKSTSHDILPSGEREENIRNIRAGILDARAEQSSVRSGDVLHDIPPRISNQRESQSNSVAISPDEMYHFVFAYVEDEMGADPAFLIAVIVEFLRSLSKERFKVEPNIYIMIVNLLCQSKCYTELGLFVLNKILEPSKGVALQLLESGCQNLQTRKLGREMLRQLSLHHDYVTVLLQDGYYLEALRYARKNKVITVQPSLFLEAALATNNTQHFAAVLRFFCDFMPGFKETSDCSRYRQILTEIS